MFVVMVFILFFDVGNEFKDVRERSLYWLVRRWQDLRTSSSSSSFSSSITYLGTTLPEHRVERCEHACR